MWCVPDHAILDILLVVFNPEAPQAEMTVETILGIWSFCDYSSFRYQVDTRSVICLFFGWVRFLLDMNDKLTAVWRHRVIISVENKHLSAE